MTERFSFSRLQVSETLLLGPRKSALGSQVQILETRSSGSGAVLLGGEAQELYSPAGHEVILLTPSLQDWAAGSPASLQLGDTWCSFRKPPSHLSIHVVQLCPPTTSSTLYACTQMHTLTHSCTHVFSHTNPHTPPISSPWAELHIWSDGEASLATAADCEP